MAELRTRGRTTRRAATAGAIRLSRTFGAAITKRREVGAAEAYNLFWSSLTFLGLGLVALEWPKVIALPLGVLAVWFAVTGLFQAWRLYHRETTDRVEDKPQLQDEVKRSSRVI
jgi:cardiolipin synthase